METDFEDAPGIRAILDLPERAGARFIQSDRSALAVAATIIAGTSALCRSIGTAGWIAWTAADRIRDGESLDAARDLSLFSRNVLAVYAGLHKAALDPEEHECIEGIMSEMERANNGSMAGIRAQSAWKSMGAAIPLLIFMMKAGAPAGDIYSCKRYFYHFILARQLSDDMRDRLEDAQRGIRTLATEWDDAPDLRLKMAREIYRHARLAIGYAHRISCFSETGFLERLPMRYADMAERLISAYN